MMMLRSLIYIVNKTIIHHHFSNIEPVTYNLTCASEIIAYHAIAELIERRKRSKSVAIFFISKNLLINEKKCT